MTEKIDYTKLEDLHVTGTIPTTITGIDRSASDWVEQAVKKTEAATGDDYVELDHGVLTVNQINAMLSNINHEVTTCDSNNQYLYYNRHKDMDEMVAKRNPEVVGASLYNTHPPKVEQSVARLIHEMRTHEVPRVVLRSNWSETERFVTHNHRAFYNQDGEYVGTMEWVQDNMPYLDYYCKMTGQKLVDDENAEKDSKPKMYLDARSSRYIDRKQ